MAKFTRIQVAQVMAEQGMVPIFYNGDLEICKKVISACYKGGSRIFEFTNRGDFAHEIFGELIKYATSSLPDMILGVGSITDNGTAALFIQNGANFIVTPAMREDIAITCNRRKIAFMPGCGTLTEIGKAEELGCEIVKLFPGSTYGPDYVKAVKGPQPWTSIMPTGGVTPMRENLKAWFDAGVICVGMGSKLISKEFIKNDNYQSLEDITRKVLGLIHELRN